MKNAMPRFQWNRMIFSKTLYLILLTGFIITGCTKTQVIREKIEWCDFWWANEPDTEKPRVLFIGDSISRGYYKAVSEKLPQVNCDRYATSRSIADPSLMIESKIAMANYNHVIIHFNNGLHGWHLDNSQYEMNLRKFVKFLKSEKSKNCKLVYSLTTPFPSDEPDLKLDPDKNQVVIDRNNIAKKIMQENNIPVIDLYNLVEPELEKYSASKGNVHYNQDGYNKLADKISKEISNLLNE